MQKDDAAFVKGAKVLIKDTVGVTQHYPELVGTIGTIVEVRCNKFHF